MRALEGACGSGCRTRTPIGPVLSVGVVLPYQTHNQLPNFSEKIATTPYKVATFKKLMTLIGSTLPSVSMHGKKFLSMRPMSPRVA
jgi:hypothetical protein